MDLKPFERSRETDLNLKDVVFFHGAKSLADVATIRREGFRSEWVDPDGRWFRDGNLGVGVYLSCNWKTALWFGPTLLRATLLAGTRIFDAASPVDSQALQGLKRRFGAAIVDAIDFRSEMPSNKKICFPEFAALFRYHYQGLWPQHEREWSPERDRHHKALKNCLRHLRRCGYHGYGHPADDNGILIFQPERIVLEEIIANVPFDEHSRIVGSVKLDRLTMRELTKRYPVVLSR